MTRRIVTPLMAGALTLFGAFAIATPAGAVAPTKSTTFAGYEVDSATITTISAVVKVPKLKCTKAQRAFQTGIDLNGQHQFVFFTDSDYTGVSVWDQCEILNGKPKAVYQVVVIADNAQAKNALPVAAGQVIKLSVTQSATKVVASATDTKTHKVLKKTAHAISGYVGLNAQVGAQDLQSGQTGKELAVPTFTRVRFSNVSIGGKNLGVQKPVEFIWVRGAKTLVSPTAITRGNVFNLNFKHN